MKVSTLKKSQYFQFWSYTRLLQPNLVRTANVIIFQHLLKLKDVIRLRWISKVYKAVNDYLFIRSKKILWWHHIITVRMLFYHVAFLRKMIHFSFITGVKICFHIKWPLIFHIKWSLLMMKKRICPTGRKGIKKTKLRIVME